MLFQLFYMKTGGGLYPHHQDKDRPVLPIFIGYRTDLIPSTSAC